MPTGCDDRLDRAARIEADDHAAERRLDRPAPCRAQSGVRLHLGEDVDEPVDGKCRDDDREPGDRRGGARGQRGGKPRVERPRGDGESGSAGGEQAEPRHPPVE